MCRRSSLTASHRSWILLALCVCCPAASREIAGRVIDAIDRSPLPSVELSWAATAVRSANTVIETDSEGRFTLPGATKGGYRIQVRKRGYLTAVWRIPALDENDGRPLTLQMIPSGAISGTVTDAAGRSLPGMRIRVVRSETPLPGTRPLLREAVVDDRGKYRVFDLRPGEYSVSLAYGATRTGYGYAVFPAGGGDARKVLVVGGDCPENVDFSLVREARYQVTGSVRTPHGGSATAYSVAVIARGPSGAVIASAFTKSDGSFVFSEITPGSYELAAAGPVVSEIQSPMVVPDHAAFGRIPLEVTSNLEDVLIPVAERTRAVLGVRIEKDDAGRCPPGLEVMAQSMAGWGVFLPPVTMRVQVNGENAKAVVPAGAYSISFPELGSGCYVRGFRYGRSETVQPEFHVTPANEPIELLLSSETGGIVADVLSSSGSLTGAGVVLLPEDPAAPLVFSVLQVADAKGEGVTTLNDLAPGRYRLAVVGGLLAGPAGTAWLQALARAEAITLAPGEYRLVKLHLGDR
jgi:Carboxypeptidase regulatory-like domain